MSIERSGGFSKDWVQILRDGESTSQDLYDLVDEVMTIQNSKNPTERPDFVDPKYWDPTAVGLLWNEGSIQLDHQEPSESGPYEAINADISYGFHRHAGAEYFQLRRYPTGDVKVFWVRPEPTQSEILDETLEDQYLEVPLNPARIKRIGQVVLFAHVRTMVEV